MKRNILSSDVIRWLLRLGLIMAFVLPANTAQAAECSLRAGYEEWRPYQFADSTGPASGMGVDVLRAVAERVGCRLEFVQAQPKRLLFDLRSGDLDVTFGYIKEEWRKFAYYTRAFRNDTKALYVRKGLDRRIRDLDSFLRAGYRLGIVRGVSYGRDVMRLIIDPPLEWKVEPTDKSKQNMKKLLAGRIDGAIINPPFVVDFMRTHNLAGGVEHRSLIFQIPYILMFSKESVKEETVRAFDRAIEGLQQDGTIDKILAKYLE